MPRFLPPSTGTLGPHPVLRCITDRPGEHGDLRARQLI